MSTLQLSRDSHYALERLLKKTIEENRTMAKKYPTVAAKLNKEADEFNVILQQMLNTPMLSPPRLDQSPKKTHVAECDRPKFRMA